MSERRTRRSQFSIGFDTKDVPGKIVEYRVVFETWEHQDRGFESDFDQELKRLVENSDKKR